MKTHFSNQAEQNAELFQKTKNANYCGLHVEVVCRMEHCSLVRYRDREFVINTEDLCQRSLRCAA